MTQVLSERTGEVTLKGKPITLIGDLPAVGDKAPDFQLVKADDMATKTLADYAGKVKVLAVVPSLDTPTCDSEARRFNEEATKLGDDVVVLTVSMDLPPAIKRWCGAAGIKNIECLSDYKEHSFGPAYGVRIKEIGFLTRAIFVIDRDDVVRYVQLVPEIADEPDYDEALEAAKKAA